MELRHLAQASAVLRRRTPGLPKRNYATRAQASIHAHSPIASTSTFSPSVLLRSRLLAQTQQARLAAGTFILSQSRAFSLWPKGNSPAPIIGSDGKLEQQSSQAPAASTAAEAQQIVSPDSIASSTPPTASNVAQPTEDLVSKASDAIAAIPQELAETVEETRRTLADYDLGKGTFTGPIQHLLEWTHVTTGLPWWLSIGLVVIGVRLLLLPVMVTGIANNARLALIQPRMMANINKIKALKADPNANQMEVQRIQLDTRQLLIDNNCNPLRGLILPLVQMPLFITFFFALRGMATSGLPDFATGGAAWFTDLSMPDPYYVLPVLSSAATLAVLQVGEFGMPEPQGVAKGIRSAIKLATPLIIWFTSSFPAAVLVYWVTHNSFSVLQTFLMRLPAFKRWANIPDPPPRDPTKKTDVVGFRQAFTDTREAFSDWKERSAEKAHNHAMERQEVNERTGREKEFAQRKAAELDRIRAAAPVSVPQVATEAIAPATAADLEVAAATVPRSNPATTAHLTPEQSKQARIAAARSRRESTRQKKTRI